MTFSFKTTHKPCPVNQRYTIARGQLILSKKYRESKNILKAEIHIQSAIINWKPLKEKVTVTIGVGFPRYDIDAPIKILLDAMTGIVYEDDKQVSQVIVFRIDEPMIRINVETMK